MYRITQRLIVTALLTAPGAVFAASPVVPGFERAVTQGLPTSLQGDILRSELGCLACHSMPAANTEPAAISTTKSGPSLAGISERLKYDWVKRFVQSPHQVKPGATMPSLLGQMNDKERGQVSERILHYLASLKAPAGMFDLKVHVAVHPTLPRYWEKGNPQRGNELYHSVGCIACHEVKDDKTSKQPSRLVTLRDQGYDEEQIAEMIAASGASVDVPEVPHANLSAKYQKQALAIFLFDPHRFRPASRMPATKLSPSESADIVAFLMKPKDSKPADATTGDATTGDATTGDAKAESATWPTLDQELAREGKILFDNLGCVRCHMPPVPNNKLPNNRLTAGKSPPPWTVLRDDHGCLSAEQQPADYSLNPAQRAALSSVLTSPSKDHSDAAVLEATLLRFNCLACHQRDSIGGIGFDRWHHFETVGSVDIGDEGRIPPRLDGVGRKLQNAWLGKVLAGDGDLRSHLQIRMPTFRHATIDALPTLFESVDEGSRKKETDVFPPIEPTAALAIAETGCVQCHVMGGERLPGVVGVEIVGMRERIRPEWFRDFLRDPASLKPRTRMPTFFPKGRSTRPDLLDGNVDHQIASLWWYLNSGSKIQLPEKLNRERLHNFELIAESEPIVLRTFFEKVGTHAICVGFPEKLNLAFDGKNGGPAVFWKGRYLDAHGTWYDRFVPPAKPLGTDVTPITTGVGAHPGESPLPWPTNDPSLKMRGYRLKDGVPVFRYEVASTIIQDRISPRDGGFQRELKLESENDSPLWIQLATGAAIAKTSDGFQIGQLKLTGDALSHAQIVGEKPQRLVINARAAGPSMSIFYKW